MLKHKPVRPKTSEKRLFKSGDLAPVSGNYRFERHDEEVPGCVPRYGAYVHLMKGMKIPLHDDCSKPAAWWLMTITEEDPEMMLKR